MNSNQYENRGQNGDVQAEIRREEAEKREQFRLKNEFEKQQQYKLIAEKMQMASDQKQQTDEALKEVETRVLGGTNPNPTLNINQNAEPLKHENPIPIAQGKSTPLLLRPFYYVGGGISAVIQWIPMPSRFRWEREAQWRARMDQELQIYHEAMEEQKRLKTEETHRELIAIRKDVQNHREQIMSDAWTKIHSINFGQHQNPYEISLRPPNQNGYGNSNSNLNTFKEKEMDLAPTPTVRIEDVTDI